MIIISPYARKLSNGMVHPKNYPWWNDLIQLFPPHIHIVQVGIEGEYQLVPDFRKNLKLDELACLIKECETWISVDSFFQHFAWDLGKPGIVIFSQSDPVIFGHPENINLLKDRKYLRSTQFWHWEQAEYIEESFVKPYEIYNTLINK
jgi:hypothetical protein